MLNTVMHCIILRYSDLDWTVTRYTVLYNIMYYTVLHQTEMYFAALHHVVMY